MYIIAVMVIALGGILLKKLFHWDSTASFIIELPSYKLPSLRHAVRQMFKQAKSFIYKATTIILVMNTLIWFMQAYGWNFKPAVDQSSSILASVGSGIAPLFIPLGFIGWQLAATAVTGLVAKENVVATFGVLLAVTSEEALFATGGPLTSLFATPVIAYGFLVFNLFIPPCFAAIGAMKTELGSLKWLFRALSFQLGVGYTLALLINQIGSIIFYRELATGFIPGIIVLLVIITVVIWQIRRPAEIEIK
jgi:ferrous iron transport protein B